MMADPTPFAQILIVEDIPATRQWLTTLAQSAFPDAGIYQAGDLRTARAWFDARGAELAQTAALVDLGLPDGSGIDLIREVRSSHPEVRLIVSTIYDDDAALMGAMAAGAHSYLLKDRSAEELVDLLRRAGRDEVALSPPKARRMLEHFRAHAAFVTAGTASSANEGAALTARETEVLSVIGRGLTVGEAARALGISGQTVATHLKAVYRKLGISSRAEAALEAARRGLT